MAAIITGGIIELVTVKAPPHRRNLAVVRNILVKAKAAKQDGNARLGKRHQATLP